MYTSFLKQFWTNGKKTCLVRLWQPIVHKNVLTCMSLVSLLTFHFIYKSSTQPSSIFCKSLSLEQNQVANSKFFLPRWSNEDHGLIAPLAGVCGSRDTWRHVRYIGWFWENVAHEPVVIYCILIPIASNDLNFFRLYAVNGVAICVIWRGSSFAKPVSGTMDNARDPHSTTPSSVKRREVWMQISQRTR